MTTIATLCLWIAALLPCGYVVVKRRRVDLLTVYVGGLLLFSLPLFVGLVNVPTTHDYVVPATHTVISYALAFLGAFCALLTSDSRPWRARHYSSVDIGGNWLRPDGARYFCLVSMLLVVATLIVMTCVYSIDTIKLTDGVVAGVMYGVLGQIIVVGFATSAITRSRLYMVLFLLASMVLVMAGTRLYLTMCIIAWILLAIENKSLRLAQIKLRYVGFSLGSLILVVVAKHIYGGLHRGDLTTALLANSFSVKSLVTGSEFLRTSGLLDVVVTHGYAIPAWAVPVEFLKGLPFPASWYPWSISYFQDFFQATLFPAYQYGLAYNPWAEAYAWLGLVGVSIYALVIPLALVFVQKGVDRCRYVVVRAMLLACGIVVAFWIQRNSMGTTFAYLRNIVYAATLIWLAGLSLRSLLRRH